MYSRTSLLRLHACDFGAARHHTVHSGVRGLRALLLVPWSGSTHATDCCSSHALTSAVRGLSLRLNEGMEGSEQFTVSFHADTGRRSGAAGFFADEANVRQPTPSSVDEAPMCDTAGAVPPFVKDGSTAAAADWEAMSVSAKWQTTGSTDPGTSACDGDDRDDSRHVKLSDTSVGVVEADAGAAAIPEDPSTCSFFSPVAPPRVHPPVEFAPPRKEPTVCTSLCPRLGPGDGRRATAAAAAATALCTTAVSDAESPFMKPITATHGLYSNLFQESFVNPFNGRLTGTSSLAAKLLCSVGFYRKVSNPLQLEWSPEEYMTALQKIMSAAQLKAARRQERQARQERRVSKVTAKTRNLLAPATTKTRAGDSCAELSAKCSVPGEAFMPVGEAMTSARSQLLRPFLRHGPDHWMATVAKLLERQDAFTYLHKELERLYSRLSAAYMPLKLDTPTDPSTVGMTITQDQHHVVKLALSGFNLFVGGSAGTGKTVLLKYIYRELSQMGLRVAMTATTGVTAVQLGGCTFHHAFNAPLDAAPHRWDANALRAVDVVIIDEVSLLDACMLDAFDMEARLARMHHRPFGGLQLIACGDFLQLSREDTLPAYESAAFTHLVPLRLVTPMRHAADDPLMRLLEDLRHGRFDTKCFAALDRPIPANSTHVTYLFPRRREAQQLNDLKLSELTTQEMTFTPQRGPLQLCGTFTHSALVELNSDADGVRAAMPHRERLLEMIHEESQHVCAGGHRKDGGERELAPRVADHELVIMPVRAEGALVTRFALRLRCRERELPTSGTRGGCVGSADSGEDCTSTQPSVLSAGDVPALVVNPTHSGSPAAISVSTLRRPITTLATKRTRRIIAPFSAAEWEEIATAVATRLGGRVVTMLEEEPSSMVPLSVTMALADMTSSDVALSLAPLRLKLGCRVMVNRNLSRTVSNGSVGIVEAFAPPDINLFPRRTDRSARAVFQRVCQQKLFAQLPIVRLLGGEVVQIPPISITLGGTAQSYFYGHEVLTIPLQLGYAFTVHKVQGLTLQGTVVLDCEKFFDCAHLIYVACSRVRKLDQLVVYRVQPSMIIVRRSALEFSNKLQDARNLNVVDLPPSTARSSWSQHTRTHTQRRVFFLHQSNGTGVV